MNLLQISIDPLVPLHAVELFLQEVVGWDKGSFDVMRLAFNNKEDKRTYVDYPTDLMEKDVVAIFHEQHENLELLNNYYIKPNFGVIFAKPHPNAKPDTLVNSGALNMALNVLRRAGKHEVANELEITAVRK
jgi:hypothetical protein